MSTGNGGVCWGSISRGELERWRWVWDSSGQAAHRRSRICSCTPTCVPMSCILLVVTSEEPPSWSMTSQRRALAAACARLPPPSAAAGTSSSNGLLLLSLPLFLFWLPLLSGAVRRDCFSCWAPLRASMLHGWGRTAAVTSDMSHRGLRRDIQLKIRHEAALSG